MRQRTFAPSPGAVHRRPRLLVEDPDPVLDVAEFRRYEDAGFDVALCSGPCDTEDCPLLKGEDCPLVDDADLVLMGARLGDHRAEVASAIHRRRPELPVVVQVPRSDPGQCPAGCVPSYFPVSVDGQVRVLWRALETAPAAEGSSAAGPSALPAPSTAPHSTLARLVDLLGW